MIYDISIDSLYFKYKKDIQILNGVNLNVEQGKVLAVVGLSGCGKSTLCNCINGIIPHIIKGKLSGEVKLMGKKVTEMTVPEISTIVGTVFQDPDTQLFLPTVEDELAFGPENLCIDRKEIGPRIEEALEQVGMSDFRYNNPNNLSGGQKQLIAIASVLTFQPKILLFDEVMAQVDHEGKIRIKNVINGLKDLNKTIVMIEHDFSNLDVADEIVNLKDGRITDFTGYV